MNISDPHAGFLLELATEANSRNITLMPAIGMGPVFNSVEVADVEARAAAMAAAFSKVGVTTWQLSDEWAVPHCQLPIVDYKSHFGMDKGDFNASCMQAFCAGVAAAIRGIKRADPTAVTMPVAMGWMRLGVWKWFKDEGVPLDAVGLDWYSDSSSISCTCEKYPASPQVCAGNCTNMAELLVGNQGGLFPGKPIFITEMNRKNGACNGSAAVLPPNARCDLANPAGEAAQATYLTESLRGYEMLAAGSSGINIGGVVIYELFDQPQLAPSPEAVYGLVRTKCAAFCGSGGGTPGGRAPVWTITGTKPAMDAARAFNTKPD
jgi:hypothetical protein